MENTAKAFVRVHEIKVFKKISLLTVLEKTYGFRDLNNF